jgi:hypothetical protein
MAPMSIDLTSTPHGWAYPDPDPCACGESAAMRGWQFCRCAEADGGGYPAWRCRACDRARTLGGVGRIEVPNEYGGRG